MIIAPRLSHARAFHLPVVIILLLLAALAVAVPFHHPTIDGKIIPDGNDWDSADLVVDDSHDDVLSRTSNIRRLWCTWDQDSLYVATTFQDFGNREALRVYLDLDRGIGPNSAAVLDTAAGNFLMPQNHRFELVLHRGAGDGFTSDTLAILPPRVFLVTDDSGAGDDITSSTLRAQRFDTGTKSTSRFPFWYSAEIALPWSAVYPGLEGGVPPLAVIKAVAIAAIASPDSNGFDSAPDNDGIGGDLSAQVLLANLSPQVIDTDSDGLPDAADAKISGTVTLPQDPGTGTVTVQAELIGFAGRDPGAPLSVTTTADGERLWELPRLPAGTYRVTTSALGYFDQEITVNVGQSQAVTGQDQTLEKVTTIGGTVSFAPGDPDKPGVIKLKDATGAVLQTQEKDLVGGTYTFFVEVGGDYSVEVTADTYYPAETPVTVVTGEDQTAVNFELIRHIEVSGTVSFLEGSGQPGTIYFLDSEGIELDSTGFPFNGGPFEFFTPDDGSYSVAANTNTGDLIGIYAPTKVDVEVTGGQDVTGIAVELPLAAYVSGTVSYEGPAVTAHWRFVDRATEFVMVADSVSAEGDTIASFLGPGEYRLEMEAAGYLPRTIEFNVSLEDTSLGVLPLTAVRASHLEIVNDDGEILPEALATKYDPINAPFTSSRVLLAARNDAGRDDLYDLDRRLQDFRLSVRKMDDLSSPTGNPLFHGSAETAAVDTVVSFTDGTAEFWMSNTEVEVLRVYLAQPNKEPIAGRIIVAFLNPSPTTVLLWAEGDRDTLTANDFDEIQVNAQLYDSAGKESKVNNIPVTFSVTSESSGQGQFVEPTNLTNSDGLTSALISATGAGVLDITATVVIQNNVLDVEAYFLGSGETVLPLYPVAGPTSGWNMSLPSNLSDLVTPITVSAQTIDQFGNPTGDPGQSISFSADPANLGTFDPVTAVSDPFGRATSSYTPTGTAGLVNFFGTSAGFDGDEASIRLRDLVVIPDPVWYDEPDDRQTFEQTDLTALVVANTPEELLLEIPFQSTFGDMQIHVAMETNFNAAGATSDPFKQPVNFGHALLPDIVLTSKFSVNDYGDIRRFNSSTASTWDAWSFDQNDWVEFIDPDPNGVNGDIDIQERWVTKSADGLAIRIPREIFGSAFPDSMLFEVYLTQDDVNNPDENKRKRSAFDSAPQDSTLNLTFDPDNPEDGDWDTTLGPVTLEIWGRTFTPRPPTDFPTPPTVENTRVTPEELDAGQTIILEAHVTDADDGIGDVVADLSAMGGSPETRMYDDGDAGHGDSVAGDGVFSLRTVVPISNPGGSQDLIVSAFDGQNVWANRGIATIDVIALVDPIIQVTDPVGDDHGPNQSGVARKFYTYPTNIVFVNGGFDLTGLTVFETKANVGGQLIDMIAFQVSMVDFPDPADPGTANWSPLYADLNITKIDILIDNAPGGATSSLPWRQAAFQPWDAWDWAIICDGWYKALIPSFGQNTVDSWRDNALRNDQDILLLSDPHLNTVTALVSKAAMGNPTAEDIAKWDIAVCMASHDFGGEEVLGGIRWVEEARSEWQFGGGQSGDRDGNYMDILLAPGLGHKPGLSQEEILDYDSPEALERLALGLTPVAIEMSLFEDTGPPVIDTGGKGSVVTVVAPILEAPLAMAVKITDDFRVDRALFRYRSTGFEGEGWDREVPMGFLGQDNWVVDILPSWLDSNLVYSPIDSTRYLEFEVEATDPLDKTSISPVTTLQIEKNAFCRPQDADLDTEDILLLQVDGALLNVPEKTRSKLIDQHFAEAWTGEPVDPDTLVGVAQIQWDLCNIQEAVKKAPVIPEGRPLGVFRQVFLATADTLGGYIDYGKEIPGNLQLSLHYPQDWVPQGLDENLITLYHYNPESDRWILVGGNVTPTGNNVTATINEVGTYGLFITEANNYDPGEVISGITISPNPFSPNGDGLYDDTKISFFLTEEATVTVEIYNVYGDRKKILAQTFPFSGSSLTDPVPRRVPGLIWDGTDFGGNPVPYGIYVLRILVTYNFGSGQRTIRSSHPVAVIR